MVQSYDPKPPTAFVIAAITALFVLIAIFVSSGCSSSPRLDYANANDTFIAAVQVLIEAKHQGEFTDEEWNDDILPLINAANDLLDTYDELTKAGHEADNILAEIRRILIVLEPYITRAVAQEASNEVYSDFPHTLVRTGLAGAA